MEYDWIENGCKLVDWKFDIVTKNLTKETAQNVCPSDTRSCTNDHANNWMSKGDVIMKVQWIRTKMTFFLIILTNLKSHLQIVSNQTFFETAVKERTVYNNALYSFELSDSCTHSLWDFDF